MVEDWASKKGTSEGVKEDAILDGINSMKTKFTSRFDGVMAAIESMRTEINNCTEQVSQVELWISSTEDDVAQLQATVNKLESKSKILEVKLLDLETRSRLNNLRLVGLLEHVEGRDSCSFLEKWIPEVLDVVTLQSSGIIERAYRIGPMRGSKSPLRSLIMRFLNYKDKQAVIAAA